MQHVKLRNGIYHFRLRVPEDCQDAVGKKEIHRSLKTSDPTIAAAEEKKQLSEWEAKFEEIRRDRSTTTAIIARTTDTMADFEKQLAGHIADKLHDYIDQRTEEELRESVKHCRQSIEIIKGNSTGRRKPASFLLVPQLGPLSLILGSVRHTDPSALDDDNPSFIKIASLRHVVHPLGCMFQNLHQFRPLKLLAGLTISRGG
jgi:hypothetical protein